MNLEELSEEMRHYRRSINKALSEMVVHGKAFAEAERVYRRAAAQAWLVVPEEITQAKHRESWVDGQCADLRYTRDIALKMWESAKSAVYAREKQMGSIQSEMKAFTAEADLAKYGVDES